MDTLSMIETQNQSSLSEFYTTMYHNVLNL